MPKGLKKFEELNHQRKQTDDQYTHEKMLKIISHYGNANQNLTEIPLETY